MNADLRQRIRAHIDAQARARRQQFIDAGELETCAGCGGELDNVTHGCKACWDRRLRRSRRGDPTYLAYERERQKRARARRKVAV